MNNDKKFYWIKLKTNFFSREDIDFLLSQKNGCEYVVLYQMLCCNYANNNGRLETRIGEILIPCDAEKIARDCKYFKIDTVKMAMILYRQLGLIYEEESDGILKIADFEEMVGSETKWAERKRLYRKKQEQLTQDNDPKIEDNNEDIKEENVGDIVRQEYRDKSIEYINNSVSVIEEDLNAFFKTFQIETEDQKNKIINYLSSGMDLEVIKNGLKIPFDRNVMNYDFEKEEAPIKDSISYGFKILENWHSFGVKTLEDVVKYNSLNKNRKTMLGGNI